MTDRQTFHIHTLDIKLLLNENLGDIIQGWHPMLNG
jgi:hypothetical protein